MNQILLGAAIPFFPALLWVAVRGWRASARMLIWTPVGMLLGAVWAVIPDLPRLFGAHGLYSRLARDPRTDLFFWHYTIDRVETDSSLYHAGLVLMGGLLLAAAWRELRRVETE